MKPETQLPSLGSEKPSVQYEPRVETAPNPNTLAAGVDRSAERHEQQAETQAVVADVGLTTVLPTPVSDSTTVVDDTTVVSSPMVAKDDDLIEKEWVDRAKKIVADTQNDPHQRDNAVNKLKVDYLQKRYGRELGVAE